MAGRPASELGQRSTENNATQPYRFQRAALGSSGWIPYAQRPSSLHGLPRLGMSSSPNAAATAVASFIVWQRQCPPGFVPQAPRALPSPDAPIPPHGHHALRTEAAIPGAAASTCWSACGGRVTANQVTLCCARDVGRHGGTRPRSAAAAVRPFLLLPIVFLARMTLNAIDGMLAREFGQQSPLGAYLNELCRRGLRRRAVSSLRARRAVRSRIRSGS